MSNQNTNFKLQHRNIFLLLIWVGCRGENVPNYWSSKPPLSYWIHGLKTCTKEDFTVRHIQELIHKEMFKEYWNIWKILLKRWYIKNNKKKLTWSSLMEGLAFLGKIEGMFRTLVGISICSFLRKLLKPFCNQHL